jgi:hypothetical protein
MLARNDLMVRTLNLPKEDTTKDLVQNAYRLDLDRVTYAASASSRRIEGRKGFGISSILMNAPAVSNKLLSYQEHTGQPTFLCLLLIEGHDAYP